VHGIINILTCALAAGATVEFFTSFDAAVIWERMAQGRDGKLPSIVWKNPRAAESSSEFLFAELSQWLKQRLARYKVPTLW